MIPRVCLPVRAGRAPRPLVHVPRRRREAAGAVPPAGPELAVVGRAGRVHVPPPPVTPARSSPCWPPHGASPFSPLSSAAARQLAGSLGGGGGAMHRGR